MSMCKNCGMENALETDVNCWHCKQPMANWVWKHDGKPVNLVEETSDRLYYKVEVIKFADKNKFVKQK